MKNRKKAAALLLALTLSLSLCLTGCGQEQTAQEPADQPETETVSAADLNCLIDLHLHLDGSLSMDSARELAEMQDIAIPESDEELLNALTVSPDCRDLNEYLEKFDFPCSLLQTREGLAQAVCNLEEELQAQGLIYAEIRYAPQKHCEQGMTQEEAVQAAIEGMEQCDFPSNLILCCMRGDDNEAANLETVELAAKYLGQGVCAVDLAGAEALFPNEGFTAVFEKANELGVPLTIHAGEAAGPESVRSALEYHPQRLGHGVRSAEDPELLETLAQEGTVLDLCPTSNLNTAVYTDLADYPLLTLMDAGVKVTVNTDNMSVSGTTMRQEFQNLIDTFGLTKEQVKTLLLTAANGSFADEETKAKLVDTIEAELG